MPTKINKFEQKHGHETYCTYYGDNYVMLHPIHDSEYYLAKWLAKQTKTKTIIDEIAAIGNPAYNIPRMYHVSSEELSVLEQRAPGQYLTIDVYRKLTKRQQTQIIYGIASFLVDMNELKPAQHNTTQHKAIEEFNNDKLSNIISSKLPHLLDRTDILYINHIHDALQQVEYQSFDVWSHNDLNATNVLYDTNTNTLSFIDFAEANYKFIYNDLFSPFQTDLNINKQVYEQYYKLHNSNLYKILSPKNPEITQIIKYRAITILIRRLIKVISDIHINTTSEKGKINNKNKIEFAHKIIQQMQKIEQMSKK